MPPQTRTQNKNNTPLVPAIAARTASGDFSVPGARSTRIRRTGPVTRPESALGQPARQAVARARGREVFAQPPIRLQGHFVDTYI